LKCDKLLHYKIQINWHTRSMLKHGIHKVHHLLWHFLNWSEYFRFLCIPSFGTKLYLKYLFSASLVCLHNLFPTDLFKDYLYKIVTSSVCKVWWCSILLVDFISRIAKIKICSSHLMFTLFFHFSNKWEFRNNNYINWIFYRLCMVFIQIQHEFCDIFTNRCKNMDKC
jgi:hypothetical protein